jgi:hypothetical protein
VVAIIATVAYSVDNNTEDTTNSSKLDMSADDVLVSLPALQYPLSGKYCVFKHGRATNSFEVYSDPFPFK